MRNDLPLVSVIVLSHKRPTYLAQALDSITVQSYRNLEIIVVDNKSTSTDEIARIVRSYPGVRLIRNDENLWYTGGMNRGIEAATGKYVYCTVDDVTLERDCVEHLVGYAETNWGCGVLTGILYESDALTIVCAGGEFSLTPIYGRVIHGEGQQDTGQFAQPFEVTCVDGAMVFGPLRLMKELNGFREDFLIYVDSIELSARVLKLGYKIVVVPTAKAYVLHAPHSFKPEGIAFHKIKNLLCLYLLHAPLRVLPEFYLRYGVVNLLRALCSNRKIAWPTIKALAWLTAKAPSLSRERYRFSKRLGKGTEPANPPDAFIINA